MAAAARYSVMVVLPGLGLRTAPTVLLYPIPQMEIPQVWTVLVEQLFIVLAIYNFGERKKEEKKQHGFSPGYVFQSTYACMTGYYIDSYQIYFLPSIYVQLPNHDYTYNVLRSLAKKKGKPP